MGTPPVDRQTDRHVSKHYLSRRTTYAGGNKFVMAQSVFRGCNYQGYQGKSQTSPNCLVTFHFSFSTLKAVCDFLSLSLNVMEFARHDDDIISDHNLPRHNWYLLCHFIPALAGASLKSQIGKIIFILSR